MIETNQTQHQKKINHAVLDSKIQLELEEEFQISENSFKPVTRGLGFHQEAKKNIYKPIVNRDREVTKSLGNIPRSIPKSANEPKNNSTPHGLEAFYGKTATFQSNNVGPSKTLGSRDQNPEIQKSEVRKQIKLKSAPLFMQFCAWAIDVLLILSFVILTCFMLVIASGIEFSAIQRVALKEDLIYFAVSIFAIYYMFYFSILDLNSSPGKVVFGLKLLKVDGTQVTIRQTFVRSLVSLLSGIALFLPMLLDFQGKLSDSKVVR